MGPAGGKKIGLSREAESSLEVDILSAYQPIAATSPNFKYSLINGSSASCPPIDSSTYESESQVKRHSIPLRSSLKKKQVSFDPCTLLASNARLGDLDEVKRLIEESNIDCLTPNYQTPHSLLSPLHLAASYSHLALCKYLISAGADVNIQDAEGWTPLHCATAEGHMEIIQFLLDVDGIDVNIVNEDEESVLDVAEDESIREYLEEQLQSRDSSSINRRFSQITLNDADVESATAAEERDSTGGRYTGTRGPYSMTKSSLQRNRIGYILKTNEVTSRG
ncbi:hypothetical protein K7432_017825 [Basidiobolus ranarum]|uniref:ANK_REP_REGION domain-containing protein n=1 Tax=Basidiobolus ranarum TaxID=34480 RepID=A0ABR2WCW4_9FUNG